MIDLLESAAHTDPTVVAVVTESAERSYLQLLEEARITAAGLQEAGVRRFAVVERDVAVAVRLLAAAAAVGAEACQYAADVSAEDFVADASALGHDCVVTSRQDIAWSGRTIAPEQLLASTAAFDRSTQQPVIIRTTGTTGRPKAAVHDWRTLQTPWLNVASRPGERWLMAYGPHQFAGIQIMTYCLARRATLVAPFPRQPKDGAVALAQHHVTCVSATPTYWRFLLAELGDESATIPLEQITLGGEAVPAPLLDELRTTFPGARISQVYASTEFGSVLSVRDGAAGIGVDQLYGEDNPDARMRVENGELWVRSGTGMNNYYGNTAETLPEWQSTGDLVTIEDGRVRFQGRVSEVINVGGVKVPPLPIEDRIAALSDVQLVRAYGRPNPLTGSIVALDIVATPAADLDSLRERVRATCAGLPPAWRPRSIKFVSEIRTTGGKTTRREDA